MKKKVLVFVTSLIFVVSCCLTLAACDNGNRYDNETVVDGIVLLRNKLHKKSLAECCFWDGDKDNMEFTVPEEYCGYKVKCLGEKGRPGFCGNPGSFKVYLPRTLDGFDSIVQYHYEPDAATSENTTNLNFTVNIGKYVDEIEKIGKGGLHGYGFKNDDGSETIKAYYRVTIFYNVDSGNSTFFSKDGDIYYKKSGQMVDYRL